MVYVEPAFPRGRKIETDDNKNVSKKKIVKRIKYGASTEEDSKPRHLRPKQRRRAMLEEKEKEEEEKELALKATNLSIHTIQEGMLVLGCIKRISRMELEVTLPGRLSGIVPISAISDAYSKRLQTMMQSHSLDCPTLSDLYTVGDMVYVKVISKTVKPSRVKLSLKPADLHSEFNPCHLVPGLVLAASIAAEEDYGYMMETGIRHVRAFLPRDSLRKNPADIGRNLFCAIEKVTLLDGKGATLTLKAFRTKDRRKLNVGMVNLDLIVPGCVIPFTVGTPSKSGLRGTLFDDTVPAYVNQNMLTQPTSTPESYSLFKQLDATLLYILPATKQVFVSLVQYRENRAEPDTTLPPGSIIEEAHVVNVGNSGVWFHFNNRRALLPQNVIKKGLGNIGNYEDTIKMGKFHVGSVHKLSVLRYDALDRSYIVCDTVENAVDEIVSPMDVQIGQTYRCQIKKLDSNGALRVQLGGLRGVIPKYFLERKMSIKENSVVPMKVIVCDAECSYVKFTNRSEFLRNNAKILSDWRQLDSIGDALTFDGVVVNEATDYCVVAFFNNITGILYKQNRSVVQDSAKLNRLRCGTVARFTVHMVDVENKKLMLSLPIGSEVGSVEIGQAIVTGLNQSGVDIMMEQNNDEQGTIPLENFSPFPEHNSLFVSLLKEGHQVKVVKFKPGIYSARDVRYFQHKPIVTEHVLEGDVLRASCFARSGQLYANLLLSDYSKCVTVFVNKRVDDLAVIPTGKIVMMKVKSKLANKQKESCVLKVSSTLKDVCPQGVEHVYSYMVDYLEDVICLIGRYRESGMSFANYNLGQKVVCTIEELESSGKMILKVKDNSNSANAAKGIAMQAPPPSESPPPSYTIGDQLEGRVVWVDVEQQLLHVCVDPTALESIAEEITELSGNILSNRKMHDCWVLFSNNYIRICYLKRGKSSPLVLVPVRHHYNDLFAYDDNKGSITVLLLKQLGPLVFGMHKKSYDNYNCFNVNQATDGTLEEAEVKTEPVENQPYLRSQGTLSGFAMLPKTFSEPILDDEMADKSGTDEDGSDESASDEDGNESYRDSVDDEEDEDFVCDEDSGSEETEMVEPMHSSKTSTNGTGSGVLKQKPMKKVHQLNGKSIVNIASLLSPKSTQQPMNTKQKQKRQKCASEPLVSANVGAKTNKKLKKEKTFNDAAPLELLLVKKKKKGEKKNIEKAVTTQKQLNEEDNTKKSKSNGKTGKRKLIAAVGTDGARLKKCKQPPFLIDQLDGGGNDFLLTQLDGTEDDVPAKKKTKKRTHDGKVSKALPGATNFWDSTPVYKRPMSDSSEDEDSDDDEQKKATTKKRLTAKERFETMKQEEDRLRKIEEELANPSVDPHTPDQFDRLVLAQPNSSLLWIRYMVFHMESAELDKARAVARKALKAINFREEAELLNVWIALLNLEIRYETVESFKEVLQEAIQYNDAFKVYSRVLDILIDCQKHSEVRDLLELLLKKFRKQNDMWHLVADAWYRIEQGSKAKPLLSQALKSLPVRDHIPLIIKFAFLHNRHGNRDEAYLLFEQILTSYPKRTDIWSQYVDMLVKNGLVENARQILERAVVQRLPMKNMKTLYTKYVNFEEKHGDRDSVRRVKQMATEYVQTQLNNAGVTNGTDNTA